MLIDAKVGSSNVLWQPGAQQQSNLMGTYTALDCYQCYTVENCLSMYWNQRLQPGLLFVTAGT